jgi:hydroxyethylthiazole kinase-like uncharacterized protein yjeF
MKVATADVMRRLDRKAVEEFGIPGQVLMESAARGTVGAVFRHYPELVRKRVGILAGRGNNGGDALAVSRYLLNRGVSCQVYLFAAREEIKGDAAANLEILGRMGAEVFEILNLEEWHAQRDRVAASDLLVDGIFGTGLRGEVKDFFQEIIQSINSLNRPVVAIDIPSGLDSDSGQVLGACIRASLTVTFGLPKRGLLLVPGSDYCGKIVLVDISLPRPSVEAEGIRDHLIEGADFLPFLPSRDRNAHKGQFGHLVVLAGSVGKTGAAAMVCQGALRVGTGLITLGIPESLNPIMEVKLTEPMTEPLPETREKTLSLAAHGQIMDLLAGKSALAIGPGLSQHPETARLVQKVIRSINLPAVIDADGLNAFAGATSELRASGELICLTPHPGEMARLRGCTSAEVQARRVELAREAAAEWNAVVILKGHGTVTASPTGDAYINSTGNPGMATAGTGDVLTGILTGLTAQYGKGLDYSGYARLLSFGVYLHGLAGDIAYAESGEAPLMASDLIQAIPRAYRKFYSESGRA